MGFEREKISYMIGIRIRDYRNERKMSQETLALASGLHPAYLGRIERGEKCPSIDTLYKISAGLKVPLSELTDLSGEIKPTRSEAIFRIETALSGMSESEAVSIAEIVEKIAAFRRIGE